MQNELYTQTEVHLLANVPFNSSYENVRLFDNKTIQQTFFRSFIKYSRDNFTYQRATSNSFTTNLTYEQAITCNYIMFRNTGVDDKWYYAFISNVVHLSPNSTRIYYNLDVFQTFYFDLTFKNSFIERRHGIRYQQNGLPYTRTLEEGLDYGSEYAMNSTYQGWENERVMYIIIVSAVDLLSTDANKYGGTRINGIQSPYFYYIIPYVINSVGNATVNGTAVSRLDEIYTQIVTNESLVGKVVNIYFTIYTGIRFNQSSSNQDSFTATGVTVGTGNGLTLAKVNNNVNLTTLDIDLGLKYEDLTQYDESKLLMYPYTYAELIDFNGHSFPIKLEYIGGNNVPNTNLIIRILPSLGVNHKLSYVVRNYNTPNTTFTSPLPYYGLIDNAPNDLPIIDDYTAAYIQGNKNTIETRLSQSLENTNISRTRNIQDFVFNQGRNLVSAFTGNVLGALTGNVSQSIQATRNNEDLTRNYNQQIESVNAKLADIANIPPTISQMGGDVVFNVQNNLCGFFVIKHTIHPEYVTILTQYFNRYGYKLNRTVPMILHSRQYWDYIKTIGCNIYGNVPEPFLQQIRSIFDNGVTLWHTDDIGNFDLNNQEI